jgi:hypothetical protein
MRALNMIKKAKPIVVTSVQGRGEPRSSGGTFRISASSKKATHVRNQIIGCCSVGARA